MKRLKNQTIATFALLIYTHLAFSSNHSPIKISTNSPTQLTFSIINSKPFAFTLFTLARPWRLVIDLKKVSLTSKTLFKIESPLLKSFCTQQYTPQILRIVLILKQIVLINYHPLGSGQKTTALQITLKRKKQPLPFSPVKQLRQALITAETSQSLSLKSLVSTKKYSSSIIKIVIDPGHGGKDSGALGVQGIQEKKVVLAISQQLAAVLNQTHYFKAVLTRNSDFFIPLRRRLEIARRDHADFFISIHADAYMNSYANGASVYALSLKGASTEAARWLAEKENHSELGGASLDTTSPLVRSILLNVSQERSIIDSLLAGKFILDALGNITKVRQSKVEQAPFLVLKSPDIPSLLLETGFLSNKEEAKKLINPFYQHQIALAIANGLKRYYFLSLIKG